MFDRTLHSHAFKTRALALALAAVLGTTAVAAQDATPTATTATTPTGVLGKGDSGEAVLAAQVRLDRAHFSPGEIDGEFGSNVARAVTAFQQANGLDASGSIDAATLAALPEAPALVDYTLTASDVEGPFTDVPSGMAAKSKLKHLGYASALEGIAERFHASPKLLRQLNPGKSFSTAGDTIRVPNVEGSAPLPSVAKVIVDKSDASLLLVDAGDKVLARFPATMGSGHDPLPIGEWKINGVSKNPPFNYNPKLFWDAKAGDRKATIPPGPNNPVGLVWIDLSKEHYGIHGTPEPSRIGKTQSHGCIRLTNWSALLVAAAVSPGMAATLRE